MNSQWLTGFYEGEGCISTRTSSDGYTKSPQLYISQAEKYIIKQIQKFLACMNIKSNIYHQKKYVKTHKDVYHLYTSGRQTEQVARLIYPFLLTRYKRKQMDKVFKEVNASNKRRKPYYYKGIPFRTLEKELKKMRR